MNLTRPSKLRSFLVLGRISNLPTVWSNCLAGWWLAGGGPVMGLLCVSICVSFLYVGGMFLNDAFDAGFDRNHRRTRPIPSGVVTEKEVWGWGFAWMALGLAGMAGMGMGTAVLGLLLAACILFYNAIHKIMVLAPVLMGGCRFLVYLAAASIGVNGVTGECIWKGLALGSYIAALSSLARKESMPARVQYWPCIFLAVPLVMAGLADEGPDQRAATLCSVFLILWVVWTLFQIWGREHPNMGLAVSRLLAGIVLVDWLAVADWSHPGAALFPVWFLLALLLQRFVPAT
ncbi:MAG: UbiA family prenyltransferase [Verrucomicrobiota bacterium]|jgi:4-hydroxybenzoate polyprenyltransferase